MSMSGDLVPFVTSLPELRSVVRGWHKNAERIALVPTMGALHDGHVALVRLAREHATRVVVSVFVNPAQFAPHEDYDRYPRTFDDDLDLLTRHNCDLVWAPEVAEMYPEGFATRIVPLGAAEGLESDFRPHFFAGVATVCCKLFLQVQADFAVFGEKDYQQLCVIRQTVRDLNLPLTIVAAPTEREPDGLAMSSRNRYLSEEERAIAPALNREITAVAAAVRAGTDPNEATSAAARQLQAAGFGKVDYVAVRNAETLRPPTLAEDESEPLRVLAAAWLGRTRLIDNIAV
jgi:pantoate--beta-alanine ligase